MSPAIGAAILAGIKIPSSPVFKAGDFPHYTLYRLLVDMKREIMGDIPEPAYYEWASKIMKLPESKLLEGNLTPQDLLDAGLNVDEHTPSTVN